MNWEGITLDHGCYHGQAMWNTIDLDSGLGCYDSTFESPVQPTVKDIYSVQFDVPIYTLPKQPKNQKEP